MILRAAILFGEREPVILFLTTLGGTLRVVVVIIRWIIHLDRSGRPGHAADLKVPRARVALGDEADRARFQAACLSPVSGP
jgi:hypothetical protein